MELLQVVDALSREKNIDREDVFHALEEAIQKAGHHKYGKEHDIRAHVDRNTGAVQLFRDLEVTEDPNHPMHHILLDRARLLDPNVQVGDKISDLLPPIEFSRIATQNAKQVITQKIRETERRQQYQEYKNRVGDLISGLVKRSEYGNVIVDLIHAEALLSHSHMLPREYFRNGEHVRAIIYEVREDIRGPQIILSRIDPIFMIKLFTQEVPEITNRLIEIKGVVRDPGSRAKMAVLSHDSSVDPVGACVGMRGSRVQAVIKELKGEKIDIIRWSEDDTTYVVNALVPAEVSKVIIHDKKHIEVIVPDEQLSIAIGRRAQNVNLVSELTDRTIDILTESEESERRSADIKTRSQLYIDTLDIDEVIAHLLISEGFESIEDIAYCDIKELADIEGFDVEIAQELNERAYTYVANQYQLLEDKYKALEMDESISDITNFGLELLIKLGENNIKTLDDLADLSSDELCELLGNESLSQEEANNIIMAARAHWFQDNETQPNNETDQEDQSLLPHSPTL